MTQRHPAPGGVRSLAGGPSRSGKAEPSTARLLTELTYVLPLKSAAPVADKDFVEYLAWLADRMPVIVADGSERGVFAAHHAQWGGAVHHLAVTSRTLNGKVAGVCDGVAAAQTPYVTIADDDVRYDDTALHAVADLLSRHDVVVPQNYFSPMRWHTHWDTGRTLINRALRADYAGTIGLRRDAFEATAGYCGAVLFENLELMRTLQAHGFTVHHARDVFVARRPPTARHFLGQRVRQAYDSFAQPLRLSMELGLLPLLLLLTARRRTLTFAAAVAAMVTAECGRRRYEGSRVFSPLSSVFAPLWLMERAVCSWVAVGCFFRGGVRYAGRRLACAAHATSRVRTSSCPESACHCDIALRRAAPVEARV